MFVRWDNLKVETEASHTLPGYREPAAVRTFDAPEALDIRFYEVRRKSVLNRVPKASRMPFRWTINPYQGLHPCVHLLLWGDTPILMADGRTKPTGRAARSGTRSTARCDGRVPALRASPRCSHHWSTHQARLSGHA